MRVQVSPGPPKLKGGYMFSLLKKGWMWLLGVVIGSMPSLAFAGATVHASQFYIPALTILVILVLAGIALWAIKTWAAELEKIWDVLPKLFKFIVCLIAIVWIVVILARLFGVNIV
jgi:hypothetical protein